MRGFQLGSHGFLAKDVFIRLDGTQREFRVQSVGRRDIHSVHE